MQPGLATNSATPSPTPKTTSPAALQHAESAEAQLRALQNSRTWRALQKLKNVPVRA
jgi:hypothetical protein